MKGLFFIILTAIFLLVAAHCPAAYDISYSPSDSILYMQADTMPQGYTLLFRFRDGGARLDRVQQAVPGHIITYDNIPGHLFSITSSLPDRYHKSTDYGETWEPITAMPWFAFEEGGWCGEEPGQSMMYGRHWLYLTSDGWQTYDSTHVSRYIESLGDSVNVVSLSYRAGVLYGSSFPGRYLCVSSDSGQTWAVGSYLRLGLWHYSRIGAIDEMWMQGTSNVRVAVDTGRTLIDTVFNASPPERPYLWDFIMMPTNLPGEAYLLATLDWWTSPYVTELYLYHIRNYGALVDSFYYRLLDFQIPDDVPPGYALPQDFSLAAFPNPFNSSTTISYSLPHATDVAFMVFNTLGQAVFSEKMGMVSAGEHRYLFNASDLPSGVYIARIQAGGMVQARKMVVLE